MEFHNGNQFMVVTKETQKTVAFGPFTIDKAHEFMGAVREAFGLPATAFCLIRAAMVASA